MTRWESTERWEAEARSRASASLERRRGPSRSERVKVAATGLAIPLGFLALYVLAGILTGGPR